MISMTSDDQTEQLEVARKIERIAIIYGSIDEDGQTHHYVSIPITELCAIPSRHSTLMKKRGAVEEIKKFRSRHHALCECSECIELEKRIIRLKREIKELEAKWNGS